MTTTRFMELRKMHDEPYHAIGCEILDEVAMAWRDRDALRAELDGVRGAIRADDERLYAAWVRIHGAPDDCANIGCDAPEWMADEILRLRAELDRTKGEMEEAKHDLAKFQRSERVVSEMLIERTLDAENLRRLLAIALPHVQASAGAEHLFDGFRPRERPLDATVLAIRAALERKADA